MKIEGEFYRLTPIDNSSSRYDLELLYTVGGKNPRKEFKIEGYGYPLEVALQRIINYATRQKFDDNAVVSLKDYLDVYRETAKSISKAIE
jgi:hypothetical protein